MNPSILHTHGGDLSGGQAIFIAISWEFAAILSQKVFGTVCELLWTITEMLLGWLRCRPFRVTDEGGGESSEGTR